MRVRHEAEVADAVETVGQDMEEEPADELSRLQPHHLGRAAVVIVLPGEDDMGFVEGDEEQLPVERQQTYNPQRGSKLFFKQLPQR